MINIAIIGAGLSGTLVALNVLKSNKTEDITIKLIDSRGKGDLGPAYSTDGDYTLNVPARVMGAVSDLEHFYNWLKEKQIPAQKEDYIPRRIYREYVFELFNDALNKKKSNINFERVQGEVTDIEVSNNKAEVFLEDGRKFTADKIVLALGNFPPPNPVTMNLSYLNSSMYFADPWEAGLFSGLSPDTDIYFIGTGQTTADLAAGLHRNGHKGKLFAISRRGFLPMVHNRFDVYPQYYDELKKLNSITEMCSVIRKHIKIAEKSGLDIRSVADSLRPYTCELWLNLPVEEKLKFLRHLFRFWEIIRSRIPPETDAAIKKMQASGQMKIIAGRISNIIANEKHIDVFYIPRSTAFQKIQRVHMVINCMGPETDYNKINNPLVKNLLKRGLIESDPLNIGLNAKPTGAVIHKDGSVSNIFYALGMPLRGILWEDIAAPEIRVHSYNLTELLLENKN